MTTTTFLSSQEQRIIGRTSDRLAFNTARIKELCLPAIANNAVVNPIQSKMTPTIQYSTSAVNIRDPLPRQISLNHANNRLTVSFDLVLLGADGIVGHVAPLALAGGPIVLSRLTFPFLVNWV